MSAHPDAETAPAPQKLPEYEVTLYTLYRQRIFQEYELINHRMMWMVLSHAFMLALWASLPMRLTGSHAWPGALIAFGGIVLTVTCFYSIRAARSEIERHVRKYQRLHKEFPTDPRLPAMIGSRKSHRIGHVAPECMMGFVLILWGTLLVLPLEQFRFQ